jgi:hypothetical protein
MDSEKDIEDIISFDIEQPKDVRVCDAYLIIDQHPYLFINGVDVLHHKEHCHHITHVEILYPLISLACALYTYKKLARRCNFRVVIYSGQGHAHSFDV